MSRLAETSCKRSLPPIQVSGDCARQRERYFRWEGNQGQNWNHPPCKPAPQARTWRRRNNKCLPGCEGWQPGDRREEWLCHYAVKHIHISAMKQQLSVPGWCFQNKEPKKEAKKPGTAQLLQIYPDKYKHSGQRKMTDDFWSFLKSGLNNFLELRNYCLFLSFHL